MYCSRCGKELPSDASYCPSCGARVGVYSPANWWWEWQRRRPERHEWEPMDAAWGAVRAVGFLLIIGLTIFFYPDVFVLLIRYFETWETYGHPVLPPSALGQVIIFLFATSGAWGVLSSAVGLALTNRLGRHIRRMVGGGFSLYVAYIFYEFYAGVFRGAGLVLLIFVGLAIMVLLDALVWHFVPRRRNPKQPT